MYTPETRPTGPFHPKRRKAFVMMLVLLVIALTEIFSGVISKSLTAVLVELITG